MGDTVVASRRRRALRVIPVVLVSAAWTTHLGVASSVQDAALGATAATRPGAPLLGPDVADVAPAPSATATTTARGLAAPLSARVASGTRAATLLGRPSPAEIPSAALAAYQRAETVINTANPGCHLDWQLLAAIGRVESDHGRFGGAVLDALGVAEPAIVGPPLDGARRTAVIADTDAGQYDGDTTFDRAVGPMQFIPSTWSALGVDADGDGARNPQDVDDAALAAAVLLCSEGDDLATEGGRRTAVYRYNHSGAYVDLVLSIAEAYRDGDYGTPAPTLINAGNLPDAPVLAPSTPPTRPEDDVQPVPTPSPPTRPKPVGAQADEVAAEEPVAELEPEPGSLTAEEAVEYCTDLGLVDDPEVDDDEYDACLVEYTQPAEPTEPEPTEPEPTDPAPTEPAPTPGEPDPSEPPTEQTP